MLANVQCWLNIMKSSQILINISSVNIKRFRFFLWKKYSSFSNFESFDKLKKNYKTTHFYFHVCNFLHRNLVRFTKIVVIGIRYCYFSQKYLVSKKLLYLRRSKYMAFRTVFALLYRKWVAEHSPQEQKEKMISCQLFIYV